jgi:hypothetical protein
MSYPRLSVSNITIATWSSLLSAYVREITVRFNDGTVE